MALSKTVEDSLKEAESSLRNALAFAARGERPLVCSQIANLIKGAKIAGGTRRDCCEEKGRAGGSGEGK